MLSALSQRHTVEVAMETTIPSATNWAAMSPQLQRDSGTSVAAGWVQAIAVTSDRTVGRKVRGRPLRAASFKLRF